MVKEYGLDVNPDFQRGYVWTLEQKQRFVEYMLQGGMSGRDLYFNAPHWNRGDFGPESDHPDSWYVLVDGKQRLDAALGFLNNEFPIFDGNYRRDYTDRIRGVISGFKWHVNDLPTREACLKWYLEMNSGGTVHADSELDRVRDMLRNPKVYVKPPLAELIASAHLDRENLTAVIREREEEEARRHNISLDQALADILKPKRKARKAR
jgi:hypothetical protein